MTVQSQEMVFLQFEVTTEPWNVYKLKDDTTLRIKVILKNLIKEAENSYSFGTSNVIAVIPNPNFIGLPSPPLKPGENLESYIEAEDLEILNKTERWNEYEVPSESMTLQIKGIAVSVSRTKRHDEKGLPIYLANIQLLIKPKKRRK